MLLHDRAPVTSRHIDARGIMTLEAKVARVGIQRYTYAELGMTRDGTAAVYRDPATVFSDVSLRSFRGAALVSGHPPGGVTAKTWRSLAIGHVLDARKDSDGIHVAATCQITDPAAVASLSAQRAGLSVGYVCDLLHSSGHASGEAYEFQQANIVVDHVAVVPAGTARCGPTCTFADGGTATLSDQCSCGGTCNPKGNPVSDMTTVTIGDQQIAADPRIAEEIGRLRAQLHDAYGATAGAALTADIAARRAPDTARGRYIQRLENAHRSPPNHG